MKAICKYSGIPFTIEHFPFTLSSSKEKDESIFHPAFLLNTKKLTSLMPRYFNGSLSEADTRLLFLALLNSTGLVKFNTVCIPSQQVIETNLKELAGIATFIYTVKDAESKFPSLVITKENNTLENISCVIETWNETKLALNAGLRSLGEALDTNRERALERVARASGKDLSTYAKRLAQWADIAANFPVTTITREDALGGVETVPCNQHWIDVITKCGEKNLNVFTINKGDLQDILEHLETNLEVGTLYSNALFKLLERTLDKHDNFLGLDLDAPYEILSGGATQADRATAAQKIEDNAILSMVADAPKTEPVRSDYDSAVNYLRALGKWKTAQKFLAAQKASPLLDTI